MPTCFDYAVRLTILLLGVFEKAKTLEVLDRNQEAIEITDCFRIRRRNRICLF